MRTPTPPACDEDCLGEPPPLDSDGLARVAKALAHPARIRILRQFAECTPRTAQEIVAECTLAQSTVSEHLRILREAGILFSRKDGPWTWYCMRRSLLREYSHAIQNLTSDSSLAGTAT